MPPLSLPDDHLGLYIHIPFCARKCRYCDFPSQPVCRNAPLIERYLDALAAEAGRLRAQHPRVIHSIFIGGGTPTLLSGTQLRRLWQEVVSPFPRLPAAEITLEANPGILSDDVLEALADLPLTRVSLGVQSFHPEELALLGRIHTAEEACAAVPALRAIGVPQINMDLMYALPGQTAARWAETLRQALAASPDHLSLYALILEEGTPLRAQVEAGVLPFPDETEEEQMAACTADLLAQAGYLRYEVSNAAHIGAHSRHNLGYWLGRDYLGLGAAATSAIGALRWRNTDDVEAYTCRALAAQPVSGYAERLAAPVRLLELVMLGLRLCDGFSLADAEAACACTLHAIAPTALASLQNEGWLEMCGETLRLSPAGFPIANTVMARIMADAAQCGRR